MKSTFKIRDIFFIVLASMLFAILSNGCVVPRTYPKAKWKVDKIVDKWPEVLENDTTIVRIDTTIVTEGAQVDTSFTAKKFDTVYIDREKVKIRFIRGKRDTFKITAECIPDTVRLNVIKKVPVYKLEEKNLKTVGGWNWWWILAIVIAILLIYIAILKYKEKLRKAKEIIDT